MSRIFKVYVVDGSSEASVTMKEDVNITVAQLCEKFARKRGLAPGNHSLWADEADKQILLQDNEHPLQVIDQLGGDQYCRLIFKEEEVADEEIPTPTFDKALCPVCKQDMTRPLVGLCGHCVCEECCIVKSFATCPICGVLVKMEDYVPCHFLNNIFKQCTMKRYKEEGKIAIQDRTTLVTKRSSTSGLAQSARSPPPRTPQTQLLAADTSDYSEVHAKFEYQSFPDAGSYVQFLGDARIGASSARLRSLNALLSMARVVVEKINEEVTRQASAGRYKSYFSQHDLYPDLTELGVKEKKHPLWSKVHALVLRKMKEQKMETTTLSADPQTGKKFAAFDARKPRYQVKIRKKQ